MIEAVDALIDLALREDLGPHDITTKSLIEKKDQGSAFIVAKEDFILAGTDVFSRVFFRLDEKVSIKSFFKDGEEVKAEAIIGQVKGPLRSLLSGERTALNFMQRLSGVATLTRRVVQKVKGYPVKILDTRKTTPGWRALEKEAVRVGGGFNHRFGLFDGVLIKDNHIQAAGSIAKAVGLVRGSAPMTLKIEVEVETFEQLDEALTAKADIIMLDNMSLDDMTRAVKEINGRAFVEASGGITLENVVSVAKTGIDAISIGALTSAFRAIDIGMELEGKKK